MTSAKSKTKSLTACTLLSLWPFWRWRSELLTNWPLHVRFVLVPFLCFGWLDAAQHKLFATLHITQYQLFTILEHLYFYRNIHLTRYCRLRTVYIVTEMSILQW